MRWSCIRRSYCIACVPRHVRVSYAGSTTRYGAANGASHRSHRHASVAQGHGHEILISGGRDVAHSERTLLDTAPKRFPEVIKNPRLESRLSPSSGRSWRMRIGPEFGV